MNISNYTTFDLPVPYKNLKFYPVKVKDYNALSVYSKCLNTDKNSIPDPKIISMTELEYLFYTTKEDTENTPYLLFFDRLLSLCLKDDSSFENIEESIKRYKIDKKTGIPFFTIADINYIAKDYYEIKDIIAQQNSIELIDENISKEVRDSLEEAREYKRRLSATKDASFEDYIISLSVATGWTLEYIYEMSIRKFLRSIKRMDNLISYKIYTLASMSGFVEFKDKSFIKHWLAGLDEEDKYSDVSVGLDELQDKVSFESAKK